MGILEELENIDDDCDRHGITFVKTQVSGNRKIRATG